MRNQTLRLIVLKGANSSHEGNAYSEEDDEEAEDKEDDEEEKSG